MGKLVIRFVVKPSSELSICLVSLSFDGLETLCFVIVAFLCHLHIFGPAAEKTDLRTNANSEYPDQPVHPRSLVRILAVRLHNKETL